MADFPILQTQVVIANGASLSPEVDLGGKGTLVAILLPPTWAAAAVTFQASFDGGVNWGELIDETATAKTVASVTGDATHPIPIAVDPTKWRGITALKVRSGTAATPVAQSPGVAGTTVTLLTRSVF